MGTEATPTTATRTKVPNPPAPAVDVAAPTEAFSAAVLAGLGARQTEADLPRIVAALAQAPPATRTQVMKRLQRTVGNAAIQRAVIQVRRAAAPVAPVPVQRLVAAPAATDHLTSPRFAGNARLDQAFHDRPTIGWGEPDQTAVAIIQQALLDLGFPMPVTTKNGSQPPDGEYFQESVATVKAFQSSQGLKADGIVGHDTLAALDGLLTGPSPTPVPPTPAPATEPDLAALTKAGAGPFAALVAAGALDADAAVILNYMATAPALGFAQDTASFAFTELQAGTLAALFKAHDVGKITARLPAALAPRVLSDQTVCSSSANAVTNCDDQANLGWIILNDNLIPATGSLRFVILVLSHELNHHRNRKLAKSLREGPNADVANSKEFVLPAVAKTFVPSVLFERVLFMEEIVARHVAWHVAQEYDTQVAKKQPVEKIMPKRGQLFAACFHFFKDAPSAYGDTGYAGELAKSGDNILGEQVAIWMAEAASLEFHGLAVESDAISHFWLAEIAFARGINFIPADSPDGLA